MTTHILKHELDVTAVNLQCMHCIIMSVDVVTNVVVVLVGRPRFVNSV